MNEKSAYIKEKRRRINLSQWSYCLSLSLDIPIPNVFCQMRDKRVFTSYKLIHQLAYIRYIKMYNFIFSGDVFEIFLSLNQSLIYNIDLINLTMDLIFLTI